MEITMKGNKIMQEANDNQQSASATRQPADAFPSEQQQMQAASTNKLHYSHATDDADVNDTAGTGPTIPDQSGTRSSDNSVGVGATAGAAENNSTPLRDNNASSPGLAPNRTGSYPGPGTASDRGTGSVGSTPFGTGAGDTGLETSSGLDERNTSSTNTASYNLTDNVDSPISGSGVTGSGTPGRDNQFNEK